MENSLFCKTKNKIAAQRRKRKAANRTDDAYFRKVGKQKVFSWIAFVVFAAYVLTLVYPFFWILMNAFKTSREFGADSLGVPRHLYFGNFSDSFKLTNNYGTNLWQMFGNSILVSTVSTFLTVITSSCTAYIMAHFKFKGKGVMFGVIVFSMILPVVGTLPALLSAYKAIGLYNTHFALFFLYSGGMGNNFILLYSFFKSISWQYAEAAEIDGASDFRIFLQIMMPLAGPAVVSIAVLTWIGLWNEYVMPSILMPRHATIAVGLYELTDSRMTSNRPLVFSTVIIAILPIICIFAAFQKTIMTNTVAGGLKG